MLHFACPSCNATYTAPLRKGGKRTTCPACGQTFVLPLPVAVAAPAPEPLVVPRGDYHKPRRGPVVLILLVLVAVGGGLAFAIWPRTPQGGPHAAPDGASTDSTPDPLTAKLLARVRRHKFWAKVPSADRLESLADSLLAKDADGVLFVDDTGADWWADDLEAGRADPRAKQPHMFLAPIMDRAKGRAGAYRMMLQSMDYSRRSRAH